MEFFLDTASIDDIKKWQPFGVVQGVTTNPSLLSKEDAEPLEQLKKIASLVEGPVSAQVTFRSHEEMIKQAKGLSKIANNIVVKFPSTLEGYYAAKLAIEDNISCNITLTFDPSQAIAFGMLPVTYISLIIGREEDFGLHNLERISETRQVLDSLKSSTKLLAASIRNTHHLKAAIIGGADIITIPPITWHNIYNNPQSISGEIDFFKAWKSIPNALREKYENIT
jgi:transaldolase